MTMKGKFNIQLEMVEYTRKYGIKATARAVKVTRPIVRKWCTRYKDEGLDGLRDRSRAPNHIKYYLFILLFLINSVILANDPEIYIKRGDKYYKQFQVHEALNEYQMAYSINPSNNEVLARLALVNNDIGEKINYFKQNEKEISHYKDAVKYAELLNELVPNHHRTYFLLARSYGNLASASDLTTGVSFIPKILKYVNNSITISENYLPANLYLGALSRELANINGVDRFIANTFIGNIPTYTNKDSLAILLKMYKLFPENNMVNYELAETYVKVGELEKARTHYSKSIEQSAYGYRGYLNKLRAKEKLLKLSK